MSGELYETDVVAWSEQQAELLRRAARGERVNGLDWAKLIEEIEDVGKSERRAVESLLLQGLIHILKAGGWPEGRDLHHWKSESIGQLRRAARLFTPAMRQHIHLDEIFDDARAQVSGEMIAGLPPRKLPTHCPLTLDELPSRPTGVTPFIARMSTTTANEVSA